METRVTTAAGLTAAAGDPAVRHIAVHGEITGMPEVQLAPGQHLVGAEEGATLAFAEGSDGVRVSRDNTVTGIRLVTSPDRRALSNDPSVPDLGTLRLSGLTVVGQVQVMATGALRGGHVDVDGLDIVAADTRAAPDRPDLLGVAVLQGAFTLWNRQQDDGVVLTADVRGVAAGRDGAPVRGSGVFLAGAGRSHGGRLDVGVLDTAAIFTDGGIPAGSSDTISGGVFVVYGCRVRDVRNRGPVTTYGPNDIALDNWGDVATWTAYAPLTTYGRGGVGFVNFGTITSLTVAAPIETHGPGGRGFNVYPVDGQSGPTVGTAEFARITTRGDAATGIQIAQPVDRLAVRGGIHTHGGVGESLVRGVLTRTVPHALSVQSGGRIGQVDIAGGMTSAGPGVPAVEVQGTVGGLRVGGGVHATGSGSDGLHVAGGRVVLTDTDVSAVDGAAIRLVDAAGAELRNVTATGSPVDIAVEQTEAP